MTTDNTIARRMNIFAITIPIFAENILKFFFSFADMFMLSGLSINDVHFGDSAVSAVGVVTSLVFFINIFYLMVTMGAGIVITQYNGAKNKDGAVQAVITSIILSALLGIIVSIAMVVLAKPIISLYHLNEIREKFAINYLVVYAAFSIGIAMNFIFSTILRSYGYSKEPMFVNIAANILNVFGNYCFIYGAFGFPQWGVAGVAFSTVFSQTLAAIFMFFLILKKKDIDFPLNRLLKIKTKAVKEILKIGIPNGGEYLSYNIAMIVMNFFVAQMDRGLLPTEQINLPAYTYAFVFTRFVVFFGLSTGQGTQIVTSYLVGAGEKEKAYRNVYLYFYFSFGLALILSIIMSFFRGPILSIFPMANNVFLLCSSLVLFSILLEPGRTFNLIFISGLKGAGDVDFPVKMGIVSMWGIGIVFAFLFGIVFKLGVVGIWLGISMDEWTRGIIMFFRWKSKIWQKKIVINAQTQVVQEIV